MIDIDNEDIVYMGRWTKEDDGLMHGSFECGLVLRFTGTGIKLKGPASGAALIAIDGGELQQKTLLRDTRLFRNLSEGEHTLELYAAAQQALPAIGGFTLDPGGKTLPPERGKIIEFIGDSIMEGYVDPNDAINGVINSYGNSYAFLTGRELMKKYGMRFNTVAYGGIRIVGLGDNTTGNDPLGMPERYFLDREYRSNVTAEAERAASQKWDITKYAPDYIVINLGTNDAGQNSLQVSSAMLSFLKELRAAYENAVIFVMTPFNGTMASALSDAVSKAKDADIVLFDTKTWNVKAGSDWLHPAPAAHIQASELLLKALEPYINAVAEPTGAPTDGPEGEPPETAADDPAATGGNLPGKTPGSSGSETEETHNDKKAPVWLFAAGGVLAAAAIVIAVVMKKKK